MILAGPADKAVLVDPAGPGDGVVAAGPADRAGSVHPASRVVLAGVSNQEGRVDRLIPVGLTDRRVLAGRLDWEGSPDWEGPMGLVRRVVLMGLAGWAVGTSPAARESPADEAGSGGRVMLGHLADRAVQTDSAGPAGWVGLVGRTGRGPVKLLGLRPALPMRLLPVNALPAHLLPLVVSEVGTPSAGRLLRDAPRVGLLPVRSLSVGGPQGGSSSGRVPQG